MKVREVLGVDFCGDHIRVVEVRREDAAGRAVLTRRACRTVPAGAESATVAASVRKMLEEGGFVARAAVFGLPKGRGFLRHQGLDQAEAERFSQADYVTDGWAASTGGEVVGVASRADVGRLAEIAGQAGLELLGVDLRSLGCLRSLGLLGGAGGEAAPDVQAPDQSRPAGGAPEVSSLLGLVIGESEVTMGLVDRGAVLSVQTRQRAAASDRLDRWNSALASAEQMARVVELAQPGASPDSARVIVNEADRQVARSLAGRLGVPVELVRPGADAGLAVEGDKLEESADYAAAIGLALAGLRELSLAARGRRDRAAGQLNFLRAGRAPARRWAPSRRHAVAAVAGVIVILLVVAGGFALRKRGRLSELQGRYEQYAVNLQQWRRAQQRLGAAGSWVAPPLGGRRLAHRRIYEAISDLFPLKDAYVHRAVIEPAQAGPGVNVRLEGRARQSGVLHEFVSRLNASPLFSRASLGPVADDAEESDFPKRFSVTFSLRASR